MHPSLRVAILALLACCVLLLQAGLPLDAQTADPKTQGDSKDLSPKKISLDKFTMPPGGVVVLVEEVKGVPGFFPGMVLYTPKEHQELMDRLEKLEKQLKSDRKTPHACKLNATVEGDGVRLQADLHFQADQPRTLVLIGFRGTQLSEAKIRANDGDKAWQPAVVDLGPDGYTVQVDKAGAYHLQVALRLPVTSASLGRSFDLALPGAAVTTLALDLPDAVKELRWNKSNVEKPLAPATESKHWEVAVGKVTQLQVSWKEPLARGGKDPLRTVRGQVTVRIEDAQVVTTAELTLTDFRGKEKEWRLWLPQDAKVTIVTPDDLTHTLGLVVPFQHNLKLSAPTAEPIKVMVTLTKARDSSVKIPVGPFAVQDVDRQEGTIEIKLSQEARRRLRPIYRFPAGTSIEEREPPRDQPGNDVVAVFKYGDMPTPTSNAGVKEAAKVMGAPPLEIDARTIQSKVETRVEHNLQLQQSQQGWQIVARCKIVAKPLEPPVDYVDVQLPALPPEVLPIFIEPRAAGFPGAVPWAAWALRSQVACDGEWVLVNPAGGVELHYADAAARDQRKVRIKWSQPQSKEFTATLEGRYVVPAGLQKVRLELPRPVGFLDRGGKGKMEVGTTLELLTQDGGPELPAHQKHILAHDWERAPISWDLAWRPHRHEFPVSTTTDLKFRTDRVHVVQRIAWNPADWLPGPTNQPALLCLRVPGEARDLQIAGNDRGDRLLKLDSNKHLAWIEVADRGGKGWVKVEYDFALPGPLSGQAPFRVPLLWPEQATHVETKLRLWSQPETRPVPADPLLPATPWKDAGTEIVAGEDSLPALILVGSGQDLPLVLRLQPAPATLANIVVDRVLLVTETGDDGSTKYHARFHLTKVHAANLEVRLPLPPASLAPEFFLDGKAVHYQTRDKNPLVARLSVDPTLGDKPEVILEVNYQLPRGQPESEGWWQAALHPPSLEGNVFLGRVRWQVTLPPSLLALATGGYGTTEHVLRWRGWLPSLEASISANDLEPWRLGPELAARAKEASLVSNGNTLEPLRIFRVPTAMWFLLCSGLVLVLGLALWFRPPTSLGWSALLVVVLGSLMAVAGLWTALLPALLYGMAPGFLVLGVLLPLQWLVHERYKRQLVFMPGFTRVKAGSSLLRTSSKRIHEPSTIDAPLALERSNLGSKPKIGNGP